VPTIVRSADDRLSIAIDRRARVASRCATMRGGAVLAPRARMGNHARASLLLVMSACVGNAPSDPDADDPELEDESEVEDVIADEAADGMAIAIHAIGGRLRVCGASSLNQRSGPGTNHPVLRAIPEDEQVTILEESGVWLRNDWGGLVGWSHRNYLCAITAPPPMSTPSESIDSPSAGRLRSSVHVADHARYVVANTGRNGYYGTAETVFWLGQSFDVLGVEHPAAQRPQIRDISVQAGGRPSGSWPHASHQSGRDVDVTYPRPSCSPTTGCPLSDVSPSTLDAKATWIVMETWLVNGVARRIFVDQSLHATLKSAARARGHSEAKIQQWFGPVIQHVTNHLNHFHVRFVCPTDDDDCIP
jgi:murein endopeptidase